MVIRNHNFSLSTSLFLVERIHFDRRCESLDIDSILDVANNSREDLELNVILSVLRQISNIGEVYFNSDVAVILLDWKQMADIISAIQSFIESLLRLIQFLLIVDDFCVAAFVSN